MKKDQQRVVTGRENRGKSLGKRLWPFVLFCAVVTRGLWPRSTDESAGRAMGVCAVIRSAGRNLRGVIGRVWDESS